MMNDKRRKLRWQLPFLAFLVIGTIFILSKQDRSKLKLIFYRIQRRRRNLKLKPFF